MHQGANRPGPQYLEDLATGYWFSEVLFTAVELDIFTHIERGGKSVEEISENPELQAGGNGKISAGPRAPWDC